MLKFYKTHIEDIVSLQKWHDIPAVNRWVQIDDWNEYFLTVSALKNYYLYSVFADGIIIAYIAAEIKNDTASICLVVDPDLHGRGIGTCVLQELIYNTNSLFGNIKTYTAAIFPDNTGSVKCFKKVGFVKTGQGDDGEDFYTCTANSNNAEFS